jgi:general secretion pathway protein C
MKFSPRHLIWVNLVLLAFGAYWGARTVNSAVAAKLVPPLDVRLNPPPPPPEKEPRRASSYYSIITSRDIFNSTKPQTEAPPAETPKPTELRLKLWGVVVHDDGSSYCVIEDLTTRQQQLYRVSDTVASVATVKAVEWDKVVLERDGRDEILELEKPVTTTTANLAANVQNAPVPVNRAARRARNAGPGGVERPGAPPGGEAPQDSGTIKMVGEGQYEIDRAELDSALDNMNQLITQVRAVPHFQGGESTGFRLFAIRQNSIFDRIGLRNGDIIKRVNGTDVSDASRALGLFQNLRNERQVVVELVRNKEDKTLSYSFR